MPKVNNNPNTAIVSRNRRTRNRNSRRTVGEVGRFADDAWSLSKRAINGVNRLIKMINTEFKYSDTSGTATAMTQAGGVASLCQIAQGSNVTNRTGDSIKTQYIEFKGHVILNTLGAKTSARVIIARDLQNVGSTPAGSDLLTSAGSANAPTSTYNYFNHTRGDVPSRFTILYDEIVALSVNGVENCIITFESPLNQHVRFSGTTTTATREGSLWFFVFSNEAMNTPTIDWDVRLFYTDD